MAFKKYNRRAAAILIGFLVGLGSLNWIIDPFGRNGRVDLGLQKEPVSAMLSYQMYKIFSYAKTRQATIVLGDSRSLALEGEYFAASGMPDVYNFAYGGGTLYEAIDTFWYAAEFGNLQKVVFGIPFSNYNETNSMNRFPVAREVARNPLSYYLSPLVTKATVMNILTWLSGHRFVDTEPDMSPAEFWTFQLGEATDRRFSTWRRPVVLASRLAAVRDYCQANDIEIVVFIPPSYNAQQRRLAAFDLDAEYARYKTEMKRLGQVLDYEVPGALANDRANFLDPRHCIPEISRRIVGEIVGVIK